MIGVNNAPLVFANGAPAATAAHAIKLCRENLRLRCSGSQIVLVKILPAFDPGKEAGKAVVDINTVLDRLNLDRDPQVQVLDLWADLANPDNTLKTALYSDGHLHLGPAGYEALASRRPGSAVAGPFAALRSGRNAIFFSAGCSVRQFCRETMPHPP